MSKEDQEIIKLREEVMSQEVLPRHIAIIMDGNGRWAKQRGLPRVAGHNEGINSVREVTRECGSLGIKVLTLYTFSVENWSRPKSEVSALMTLLLHTIRNEIDELHKNNVRLTLIGHLTDLPDDPLKG
nr:polyprenyl diphosphate synthase [Candidatus Neomarinimicrobiota bacterium]